jgi:NADPH-dependent 2,4-dienoyl-CoA reductase/sulfur reductase-like enzyme/rhodanese-related sulfurtransferase
MKIRIVIVGANAAGAKAASKAKRMNPHAEVTLVDRGNFISYGACGIPYYVSETVADVKELMSTPVGVVRDAAFFNKVKGVNVITGTEAVAINREARTVELLETDTSRRYALDYDRLVLATGSTPFLPRFDNSNLEGILTVKSIEDAELLKSHAVSGKQACIVGAGLIGLETAEALRQKGLDVTVMEMRDQVLPGVLDAEMAALVEKQLRMNGVQVMTSCRVTGFAGSGRVQGVIADKGEVAAQLVVVAPGVRPNSGLAREAGLEIGATGAIAVDSRMQTSDPHIFACGDCCESLNLVNGSKVYVPLGSTANKQGRVAGINAAGGNASFAGILGTSILKVFAINAGKTGRILGLQAVGEGAVDKRLDAAAAAITFKATAEQLSQLDLAYAPPYSAAMDNLIVAADILKNKLAGHALGISPREVKRKLDDGDDFILLDVRSPAEHAEVGIEGAKLIPLGMLREKLDSLPRDKEIVTFCKISLRGYEAQKILDGAGFKKTRFLDGGVMMWPYELRRG